MLHARVDLRYPPTRPRALAAFGRGVQWDWTADPSGRPVSRPSKYRPGHDLGRCPRVQARGKYWLAVAGHLWLKRGASRHLAASVATSAGSAGSRHDPKMILKEFLSCF